MQLCQLHMLHQCLREGDLPFEKLPFWYLPLTENISTALARGRSCGRGT